MAGKFTTGFLKKTAAEYLDKEAAMSASTKKKLYKGLEYGGLGTLAGIDLHNAYKAHKEGEKGERNKALLGAGALGGLMAATRLAH